MSRAALLVLILVASNPARAAETLADSARILSKRIVAALTPGEGCELAVRNASSLPSSEVTGVRQALAAELRCIATPGAASVIVTLSENPEGYLWVAEIAHGGERDVVLIEHPRGAPSPASGVMPASIQKVLLLPEAPGPILDAAVLDDTGVILQPDGVGFLGRQQDRWKAWTVEKFIPIPASSAWPRDLRGRLVLGDSVRVFLPGVSCEGKIRPEPSLECRPAEDEWPATPRGSVIAAGRNFFTAPGLPPFFSTAKAGSIWLLTGVDGRVQLYDEDLKPAATFAGWGSEIAAIAGSCGRGFQVLATKPGDWDEPDTIQVFEIVDRQPEAVSVPVEFDGPVTALWQSSNPRKVIAISRNPETGRYAVFSLSTYCSH